MMTKSTQSKSSSRRRFIKDSALTAAAITVIPRFVLGGPGYIAPSDKVNVGIVGVGGRGKENIQDLFRLNDVQVTAIADPAEFWDLRKYYYNTTAGRRPVKKMIEDHYSGQSPNYKVKDYADFRHMLEQEKELDAILCASADHIHAYVCIKAMQAGKHVYCEKPLTHNIWEARQVRKITQETGLATQMGNQLHSSNGIRQTVEYLRAGIIGEVSEVHAWVPASRVLHQLTGVPSGNSPVPYGFEWDLWLGPRTYRDFHESYAPFTWRDFWDFGCGAMGDFGCHDLDAPVWGLELQAPESVQLYPAGYGDQDIVPYGEIGYYEFNGTNSQNAIKLNWYSGGLRPPRHDLMPAEMDFSSRGAMYIGSKGIMVYEGRVQPPQIFPETLRSEVDRIEPTLSVTNGHHRDWIDAVKGGSEASSNFDYASRLTEITLLGVLSLRIGGKKIDWDAQNMRAKNLPEADPFIRESVRSGWEME